MALQSMADTGLGGTNIWLWLTKAATGCMISVYDLIDEEILIIF